MRTKMTRCMLAVVLAVFVCLSPFVDAKKANAIAPAIPVAAGAAALAAELGISLEALMAGTVALVAGGTGVYLLSNSQNTAMTGLSDERFRALWLPGSTINGGPTTESDWLDDYKKYKMPGVNKSWEDLTDEEKAQWGNPANYVASQFLALQYNLGMVQDGGDGPEPTPEPDKNTDPEGHEKWQKMRNVLSVLGVSGAAVGLSAAVDALGDAIEGGISGFLFTNDDGLMLPYSRSYTVSEREVTFSLIGQSYGNYNTTSWCIVNPTNAEGYFVNSRIRGTSNPSYENVNLYPYNDYFSTDSILSDIVDLQQTSSRGRQNPYYLGANSQLNAVYGGTYNFNNGVATYTGGAMVGEFQDGVTSYQQMTDTPVGHGQNIIDNSMYNTYINNYQTDGLEPGYQRAIVVPSPTGDTVPTYNDYVRPLHEDYVTPIPDDEPVVQPDPKPQPGPTPSGPTKPDDWDNDYTDTVNHLLSTPFDQLFPFCLIADFRDFTFLLLSGQSGGRLQPGQINTQSNIPTDQLNGVHTLRLDFSAAMEDFVTEIPLDPLHQLLGYTRFTLTCLLIMAVVYESFGFFLKRGA